VPAAAGRRGEVTWVPPALRRAPRPVARVLPGLIRALRASRSCVGCVGCAGCGRLRSMPPLASVAPAQHFFLACPGARAVASHQIAVYCVRTLMRLLPGGDSPVRFARARLDGLGENC
jgi:hypothetical protein